MSAYTSKEIRYRKIHIVVHHDQGPGNQFDVPHYPHHKTKHAIMPWRTDSKLKNEETTNKEKKSANKNAKDSNTHK